MSEDKSTNEQRFFIINKYEVKEAFEAISLPSIIVEVSKYIKKQDKVYTWSYDFDGANAYHLLDSHISETTLMKAIHNDFTTGAKTEEEFLELIAEPISIVVRFNPDKKRGGKPKKTALKTAEDDILKTEDKDKRAEKIAKMRAMLDEMENAE